ncbi:hypothetical protein HZA44_03730 [Candidatus Peregrinibacteria bacterium]|nr:hypothetical protein [Candidatus Peregrinibacteria bacterium]
MEKNPAPLAISGETLAKKLEQLPNFSDSEKLVLKLLVIQKVRGGIIARLHPYALQYALKDATDDRAKILSIDPSLLSQEENHTTLAIANQLGIDAQRFKELIQFVIENEQTW